MGAEPERRLAAVLVTDMVGYSGLIAIDQTGTLERQKTFHRELIAPTIKRKRGEIIKLTGDGVLAAFSSASDAVQAALEIQQGMRRREAETELARRIQYRCGVNVGDVIFDDGDIFGDVVNLAARLESLAQPDGICISDTVYQLVADALDHSFENLGAQKVKNISRPIQVWQWTGDDGAPGAAPVPAPLHQQIQFCVASDGTQIAYAKVGKGPTLFKAPNWLNHLDYEWRSAIWGPFLSRLAKNNTLVRFDQRGGGLSDWDVPDITEEAMVTDMNAVVGATGINNFALFGISQGCSFSIRYAVENPDKVSCLVLLGGFVRGALRRNSDEQAKLFEAAQTMITQGWGSTNPHYRHFFTTGFIPDATPTQQAGFDELQRVSVGPANVARINNLTARINVADLARQISVPTLVLHCEGDRRVPMEEGRRMAALIPGARFVPLKGSNHALVDGTAAFDTFFEETTDFLSNHQVD